MQGCRLARWGCRLTHLEEGEGHAAADDDLVDLVAHVLDEQDLVGDLGAAEDGQHRLGGRVEHLGEGLELLGHEEAAGLGGVALTHHGGVCAVRGAESVVDVDVAQLGERGAEDVGLRLVGLDLVKVRVRVRLRVRVRVGLRLRLGCPGQG